MSFSNLCSSTNSYSSHSSFLLLRISHDIDNLVGFYGIEYLKKHRTKALQLTQHRVEALTSYGLSNDGDMVGFIALVYFQCALGDKALGTINPGTLRKHCRFRRLDDVFATSTCADTFVHRRCSNNFVFFCKKVATDMAVHPGFLSVTSDSQFIFYFGRKPSPECCTARHFLWTKKLQRRYDGHPCSDPAAFKKVSIECLNVLRTAGARGTSTTSSWFSILMKISKALIDRQDSPDST